MKRIFPFLLIVLAGCSTVEPGDNVEASRQSSPDVRSVRNLSPTEIVDISQAYWIAGGLNVVSLRLLYHGLSADDANVEMLQTLADVFVEDVPPAAMVLYAYLQSENAELNPEQQLTNKRMLSSAMWIWGLSRRRDGSPNATLGEIYDQPENDLFIYDMERFDEIVNEEVRLSGNLVDAKNTAIRFAGVLGGAIANTGGSDFTSDDLYSGAGFVETEEYLSWLDSEVQPIVEPVKDLLDTTVSN